MPKKDGHYITPAAAKRFKRWLFNNEISLNQFAKRAGCSRQYLTKALDGQIKITNTVREWFLKGGYELL